MAHSPVLIGTRGSALAVTQTTTVANTLAELGGFDVDLVRVRTEGDVNRAALSQIGGTGVFVAALRESLLAGDCDVAVHSLKDLPTAEADGLTIGAIPARVDVRDALCARDNLTLAQLPAGSKIGTGSPRRAAQLRAARPDLEIIDIRGNVDTRLGRVAPHAGSRHAPPSLASTPLVPQHGTAAPRQGGTAGLGGAGTWEKSVSNYARLRVWNGAAALRSTPFWGCGGSRGLPRAPSLLRV